MQRASTLYGRQTLGAGLLPALTALCFLLIVGSGAEGASKPLVLAVDGADFGGTLKSKNPTVKTGYLSLALQGKASLDLEIKPYAWSGNVWQTRAAVADLKRNLQQTIEVARNDRRPLVIVAHSWGGILSYLALQELDAAKQLKAGDVDLLLTIHTPLGMPAAPNSNLATVAFTESQAVHAIVKSFVSGEVTGVRAGQWKNYWSQTDWLSGPINPAQNVQTNVGHSEAYTDAQLFSLYITELAKAARTEDTRLASKSGGIAVATEVTFRMKDGSTVSGQLQGESLKLKSSVGLATVPVKDIVSFSDGQLRLKDGSLLKGELAAPSIAVASRYGKLDLKPKDIAWFGVGKPPDPAVAAPAAPPTPQVSAAKPPTSPIQPVSPSSPPGPSQGGPLPQSYGVFVSSGGRLYELRQDLAEKGNYVITYENLRWYPACCKSQQIVQVPRSAGIDFIVYLRGLANAQMSLSQFYFVRKLLFINWTLYPTEHKEQQLRTPNTWIAWSGRADLVQSPIAGQVDMTRIRPREDLKAGIYGLRIQAGQERYPAEGLLVFGVEDGLGATDKHCADWKVEAGSEGLDSFKGWTYECSADAFAAIQGEQTPSRDQARRQAAVPPSGSAASKGSAKDIVRIDQEDRARLARYPAETQRWIAKRREYGREAMQRKDWKRARYEYSGIIVKYDPQNFWAHVNLTWIYAMLNEVDNAKKHFDIANRRAPSYVIPHWNMVYAYARAGNTQEAVKYLEKVVELGYEDLAKLRADTDLPESFRENTRVQQLTAKGS